MSVWPVYPARRKIGVNAVSKTVHRPIKIAYIVPHDEESKHILRILDAVFYESYTRLAGTKRLVIASNRTRYYVAVLWGVEYHRSRAIRNADSRPE